METRTETSTLDLAMALEKLICSSSTKSFAQPTWHDSSVCITNGQIAITLNHVDYLDGWAKDKALAESIKSVTNSDGSIDFDLPQLEAHASWLDPNKLITNQCAECDGDGVVICEYDHEHDCPECKGTGQSKNVAIDEWRNFTAKDRGHQTPVGMFDRRYLWIISEIAKHRELTYDCRIADAGMMLGFRFRDGFGAVMSILCRED